MSDLTPGKLYRPTTEARGCLLVLDKIYGWASAKHHLTSNGVLMFVEKISCEARTKSFDFKFLNGKQFVYLCEGDITNQGLTIEQVIIEVMP